MVAWAKPVPINPANFKNPRRDDILVSLMGPLSNFGVALLCVFGYMFSLFAGGPLNTTGNDFTHTLFAFITKMFAAGISLNIFLAVFNLIPVPPLDGSHVLCSLLPEKIGENIVSSVLQEFLLPSTSQCGSVSDFYDVDCLHAADAGPSISCIVSVFNDGCFMSSICYKENMLMCEEVPFIELAEEYGTPLYVYSKNQILKNFRSLKAAFWEFNHTICYALKANSNPAILKIFAEEGAGADIVSAGELYLALKAGFPPHKTAFAGVGKRDDEIEYALQKNIFAFNVESVQELQAISRLAMRLNVRAGISFRINPHIDAQSHPYITTGLHTNKFGIEDTQALEVYLYAATLPAIDIIGIHTHIGSQIIKIEPFIDTARSVVDMIGKLREAGIVIRHIDFGGGFGVKYFNAIQHEALPVEDQAHAAIPSPADIMAAVLPILDETGCSVWIEPGRSLIADTGAFTTKVLYTKETSGKKFVVVDGAMNDLLRPSLYGAHHQICTCSDQYIRAPAGRRGRPICESGDFLAKDRMLAKVGPGDILAVLTAGAMVLSIRRIITDAFVRQRSWSTAIVRVIRPRQTFEELIQYKEICCEALYCSGCRRYRFGRKLDGQSFRRTKISGRKTSPARICTFDRQGN